jgi:hypothetical protein
MPPSLLSTDLSEASQLDAGPPTQTRTLRDRLPHAVNAVVRTSAFYRRALVQSPVVKPLSDAHYQARLARHAGSVPTLSPEQRGVLAEMRTGAAVRPIDMPAAVLASADRFADLLRGKRTNDPCVKATPDEISADPRLFTWGLRPHLLDLAEAHIGLPVRYLGMEVKRELVVDHEVSRVYDAVRCWHLDHEDRRIVKVIVYLTDVHLGAAPFGYVEQSHTERIRGLIRHHHDTVSDERMETVVPRDEWHHVTGPRMTAAYVDTGQLFHRVFPATTEERLSVTFAYSSRNPYFVYKNLMLPRRVLRGLRDELTPRQWDALPR